MVPGAQVLSAVNFQCTFKSACFYIPQPDLQSIRLVRSSHLSHHLKQGDINIVFSLTAVHRHTHRPICVISPLLLHSLIRTLMLLKLLASYVGLRNSTYCWLWKMLGTVNWSVTAPGAVAGVCGAPVQVVPVGPVWNSLIYVCSIYLFVLFTQCLSFFKFVGVQAQKLNN